jgi:tRNA(Ile)-lysidine synthase
MINPSFRETLLETIRNIKEAEEIYQKAISDTRDSILEKRGNLLLMPVREFYKLEPLKTLAFELLSPYGFNKSDIYDIIGLKDAIPGKEVISPTHRLVKDRESLILVPRHDTRLAKEYEISSNELRTGIKEPVSLSFEILHEVPADLKLPSGVALLDLNWLVFPLLIRKWKRGDHFIPFGMSKPKKLSDFFIDQKFSRIDKENQWLLCSGDEIVWVIGHRINDLFKIVPGTVKILKIIPGL